MLDYQLFTALITIIEAAQPAFGMPKVGLLPSVPIYQKPQVTQQGVPVGPCGFLQIVTHQRNGSPSREDFWDTVNSVEIHREVQWYRTTFQFDAMATQDPVAVVQYSAGDLVNLHSALLQSDTAITQLRDLEIAIERIVAIRNTPFVDDRDRFALSPSFDFTLSHKQIVQNQIPVLQSTEFRIRSV